MKGLTWIGTKLVYATFRKRLRCCSLCIRNTDEPTLPIKVVFGAVEATARRQEPECQTVNDSQVCCLRVSGVSTSWHHSNVVRAHTTGADFQR
ncbi:hypothetical protein LSAT2_001185 [Lamellibrachia satsuma]|nr:hypothetical protein LSAT2_001185 [Lamellibrachia satsuma]